MESLLPKRRPRRGRETWSGMFLKATSWVSTSSIAPRYGPSFHEVCRRWMTTAFNMDAYQTRRNGSPPAAASPPNAIDKCSVQGNKHPRSLPTSPAPFPGACLSSRGGLNGIQHRVELLKAGCLVQTRLLSTFKDQNPCSQSCLESKWVLASLGAGEITWV